MKPDDDWQCQGWDDHEIFHLEVGRRMSFRAKLQWLEEADRMVRFLAKKRRWIDKDGVVHEPVAELAVAEEPDAYGQKPSSRSRAGSAGADPRG